MAKIVATHAGAALQIMDDLASIPNGSVALFLLFRGGQQNGFTLLYERGGDWFPFEDWSTIEPDSLDGWEVEAIREAIATLEERKASSSVLEGMMWFEDWMAAAKELFGGE